MLGVVVLLVGNASLLPTLLYSVFAATRAGHSRVQRMLGGQHYAGQLDRCRLTRDLPLASVSSCVREAARKA